MRLISTLLLGAMVSIGCSGDDPCSIDSSCELNAPVNADATVSYLEMSRPFCEFLERCDPDRLARYHGGDVASCITYEQCPGHHVAAWTVTPACIEALEDASCADDIGSLMHQSKVCAVGGPLPLGPGEPCLFSTCRGEDLPSTAARCNEGLFCNRDATCETEVAQGARCIITTAPGTKPDPCERGTHCDFDDGSENKGQCRPDLAVGEPCTIKPGVTEIDPCDYPALCQSGVCTAIPDGPPRAALGEACSTTDCKHGLICVVGICELRTCPATNADQCDPDDSACGPDLVCNSRSRRCERIGAECLALDDIGCFEECPPDKFCDRGTCQTI